MMPPPPTGTQLCLCFRRHPCADEEVCGRHAPVPAEADVETHGSGAETRHHGQQGHTGGGSLSLPVLEANSKRAADPEYDSRRRDGDAGVQGEGKPASSESRMWVYSSAKRADIQLRCFEYQESRSGKWAHMRRKWLEAMPEGADAKTCKAAQGYEFGNRLFKLERQFEELTAEERFIQRKEKSDPVLEAYWTWLDTIFRPTGKLKDAVTYAQNQKAHLSAFLEHGEIEISNNQVENAIRPFVVGRKGWLFADTPQGAEASAIIYSLMETAKANNLRLDDYLLQLLSILPERAEQSKDFEMDDLLRWSEEMKSWFSGV